MWSMLLGTIKAIIAFQKLVSEVYGVYENDGKSILTVFNLVAKRLSSDRKQRLKLLA